MSIWVIILIIVVVVLLFGGGGYLVDLHGNGIYLAEDMVQSPS